MTANAFVRARINEKLKDEAATVLAEMGLTVSDVVRITLTRVARDRALPFDIRVPNAETRAAVEESRQLMKKHYSSPVDHEAAFKARDRAGKQ